MNYKQSSPEVLRQLIRDGELVGHTSGMAEGYIQANVVILPSKYAYDFLKFCFRNPKTCPLLDVSEVGALFHIMGHMRIYALMFRSIAFMNMGN